MYRSLRRSLPGWGAIGVLLLFQGCATARQGQAPTGAELPSAQQSPGAPEPMGPHEAFGPPSAGLPSSYGPDPVVIKPVVLVLGPGLAKGFAYIGVIRVLESEKIPIGAVLGTEMGSLVGTLYALSPNLNQFEWDLQKFKENVFLEKKGFFGGVGSKNSPSDGSKLEAQLQVILGNKDLKDSKIPLLLALQSEHTGIPFVLSNGNAASVVRAAMASPSLFTSTVVESHGERQNAVSANSTRPFLVREARELNIGPVVVVNVLSQSESSRFQSELGEADLVIRPELKDFGYMDFEKRTDIAYRGRKATLQHLAEIRERVGLPASGLRKSGQRSDGGIVK